MQRTLNCEIWKLWPQGECIITMDLNAETKDSNGVDGACIFRPCTIFLHS